MELIVCKDPEEINKSATRWLKNLVERDQIRKLYVPAGATPEPIYQFWKSQRPDFLDSLLFIQIDDVLTGPKAGCFKDFFREQLDGWHSSFQSIELGETQADAAILGLGLNGHVAFHEPELAKNFFSGCVKLSGMTTERLNLAPGTWGISYGLGAFLRCQSLLLIVTGNSKQKILSDFLDNDGDFPALELKRHPQLTVLVDEAAHGKKKRLG